LTDYASEQRELLDRRDLLPEQTVQGSPMTSELRRFGDAAPTVLLVEVGLTRAYGRVSDTLEPFSLGGSSAPATLSAGDGPADPVAVQCVGDRFRAAHVVEDRLKADHPNGVLVSDLAEQVGPVKIPSGLAGQGALD